MGMKDLTGQRFGRLRALAPTDERRRTSVVWRCQCDCGRECQVPSSQLIRGQVQSCGCLQDETRRRDITGQRRGRLTAMHPTDARRAGATVWAWRCDCGAMVYKPPGMVREGMSTMCLACAAKLKNAQMDHMREVTVRDAETGLTPTALNGVRSGKLFRNNTSGVRGVSWHSGQQKWAARMQRDGRTITLGYYNTIEEAAKARAEAVRRAYGVPDTHDKK